jgi:protein kinase-like protein
MLEAGIVLGAKYRLDSEIGRGGMGSVWRATRLDLGTELAIKVMHGDATTQASRLERFTREAKAASRLTSPHVVRVIDFGVDAASGLPFMAMELLEGESLAARLESGGPQAPARVASIILQVARALNQAHAAGIVHRDLKPANIFLVRNEDEELVKLLDFGIAKAGDGVSTVTGSVLGTPYYMSPEQVGALKDVDHRTDIWSLGVIACECLTGRRPFAADTLSELAMKIALGRAELPSSLGPVPGGFDEWFARATHVHRSQRFQSASELASALGAVAARATVRSASAPELALAATLPLDATGPLPMARAPGRELPATATSVPLDGSRVAALSTTSGGGAAVPSPPREARSAHTLRRWLLAAAALGVGGVGAKYVGLLPSSTGAPAGETVAAVAARPLAEPEGAPPTATPERPGVPSSSAAANLAEPMSTTESKPSGLRPVGKLAEPPDSAQLSDPAAARPRALERGPSAASESRARARKLKALRQPPRALARSTSRDDAQLNAYDTQ